jgi:hypothetical protein
VTDWLTVLQHLLRLNTLQSTRVADAVFKREKRPSIVQCIRHSVSASGDGVTETAIFGKEIRNVTYYAIHIFNILLQWR